MGRTASADPSYLARLQDYYARHRVFPSYAAIGEVVGLKSTSSVSALLGRLQAAKLIEMRQRRIVPTARFFARPLVQSRVAAGLPDAAFDAEPEPLEIDAHLVR